MRRSYRCFPLLLVSLLLFTAEAVAAQAVPTGWETDTDLAAKKAEYFALVKANNVGSDQQGVDQFFDKYYFARWTLPTGTGSVRGYAQELLAQDFKDLTGPAREYLLNKSLDSLRKMAADPNVTSTGRFNAIYTIGLLNQRDAPSGSAPPVPHPQALPYLIDEFGKKDENPDYIRLGALLGIQRFAVLGIADVETRDVTLPALLVRAIQEGKPAQNRGADEQELLDWFRHRVLEVLGALKATGQRGEVVDLLLEIIESSQETPDLRCFAAKTLADLNFQAANTAGIQINYQRLGTVLLSLGKTISDIELRRVDDTRNKERAKSGIGPPLPGMPEIDPDFVNLPPETQQEVTNAVQRIRTEFFDIMQGVRGVRPTGATTVGVLPMLASDDPVAEKLNKMTRAISQLFDFLDKGSPDRPPPVTQQLLSSDMLGPASPRATAPPKPNAPVLKVNLLQIRDKLQEFSTTLDEIIAG